MLNKLYNVLCLLIFLIPCLLAAIIPKTIATLAIKALNLCVASVIPSIFPFMVVTQLVSRTDIAYSAGKVLAVALSPLLGISKNLCGAFLTGLSGGFPNGAHAVCIAYSNGLCSKQEAERTIALCNNCSLIFICSVAGVYSLGSIKAGIILFISQILSIFAVSLVLRITCTVTKNNTHITLSNCNNSGSIYKTICQSVTDAGINTLYVCSYITFFYIISGLFVLLFSPNGNYTAFIRGIFEVSGAVQSCSKLDFPMNYIICSSIVGFSGLSVIFQVCGVCEKYNVSPKEFVIARILNAIFMPIFTLILLITLPREAIYVFSHSNQISVNSYSPTIILYAILFFIVMLVLNVICDVKKNLIKKQ